MPQLTVPLGIVDVTVHADSQGEGYEIYSTIEKKILGKKFSATTQKQYIGRDGGCATFGTVDVAGTHAQIQGCLRLNPTRFEGKAEACFLNECKSKAFNLNL